jgi:hypothetical protein
MKLIQTTNRHRSEGLPGLGAANCQPHSKISGVWHPVIQAECVKMNEEHDLSVAFDWVEDKK